MLRLTFDAVINLFCSMKYAEESYRSISCVKKKLEVHRMVKGKNRFVNPLSMSYVRIFGNNIRVSFRNTELLFSTLCMH